MNELICKKEKLLGTITLVLGIIAWSLLFFGTFGMVLVYLFAGFLFYLFTQSALISYIKGNGVRVTEKQFPELYKQYLACCERLGVIKEPEIYILNGNGGINAFATKFLGSHFVILLSDVVDAMEDHEDGVKFYIGHELGHIKLNHISGTLLRWPILWIPLLGAAYSRAKERSCDYHGRACCESDTSAAFALAALGVGPNQWKNLNIPALVEQARSTSSFWMSLHELMSGYPWITKRVSTIAEPDMRQPERHPLSYVFAFFVPYSGRLGPMFGIIVFIYIGVLAAIAMPKFSDAVTKAKISQTVTETAMIRDSLASFYEINNSIPTLNNIGLPQTTMDGSEITLNSNNMVLTVSVAGKELNFVPTVSDEGTIMWSASAGRGMSERLVPQL